jgi:MFS transporter, SP family, arabinose:H+ symporter
MNHLTLQKNFLLSGNLYVVFVSFIASIGGFLFGYDLAIITGANTIMRDQFNLSPSAYSFATASVALGCMTGPFLGAWLCDKIGRKMTMICGALLLAVNSVMTAAASDMTIFNTFRIIGGVGVGLCSMASPMYIAEIAPPRMRGKLGLMYQVQIVVGSLSAALVAYFLAKYLPERICWRWMFASEMMSILLFLVFLVLIPRSPRWLAEKQRFDEAFRVLARINGNDDAERQIKEIKESLNKYSSSISAFFTPTMKKLMGIALLLGFFNNFTGWSAFGGYLTDLFKRSGFLNTSDAIFQFFLAYSFMGIVTIGSMGLIDRYGRRPLWIFSSMLMFIAMVITGVVFHFKVQGVFVLFTIFLCTIPHALALGPLPWLMMSEIFPTHIRAKAVAVSTTFLWTTIFTGGFVFPLLMDLSNRMIGSIGGAFWLLSIVCIFSFIFGIKLLPETKMRTLEEIAESLKIK